MANDKEKTIIQEVKRGFKNLIYENNSYAIGYNHAIEDALTGINLMYCSCYTDGMITESDVFIFQTRMRKLKDEIKKYTRREISESYSRGAMKGICDSVFEFGEIITRELEEINE